MVPMKTPWTRRKRRNTDDGKVVSRRIDLDEATDLSNPLSSRLTAPDRYSAIGPSLALPPAESTPIGEAVRAQTEAVAPHVDEYTADVLCAWLDEHLPGWAAHTDQETLERLATQRKIVAQNLHAVATATAQLHFTRIEVAKLQRSVAASDAILLGHRDHYPAPHEDQADLADPAQPLIAMVLPQGFDHPDLTPQGPTVPGTTSGATTERTGVTEPSTARNTDANEHLPEPMAAHPGVEPFTLIESNEATAVDDEGVAS